jgi:hypothetical protein
MRAFQSPSLAAIPRLNQPSQTRADKFLFASHTRIYASLPSVPRALSNTELPIVVFVKTGRRFDPSLRCFPFKNSGRPPSAPDGIYVKGVFLVASTAIHSNSVSIVTFLFPNTSNKPGELAPIKNRTGVRWKISDSMVQWLIGR